MKMNLGWGRKGDVARAEPLDMNNIEDKLEVIDKLLKSHKNIRIYGNDKRYDIFTLFGKDDYILVSKIGFGKCCVRPYLDMNIEQRVMRVEDPDGGPYCEIDYEYILSRATDYEINDNDESFVKDYEDEGILPNSERFALEYLLTHSGNIFEDFHGVVDERGIKFYNEYGRPNTLNKNHIIDFLMDQRKKKVIGKYLFTNINCIEMLGNIGIRPRSYIEYNNKLYIILKYENCEVYYMHEIKVNRGEK